MNITIGTGGLAESEVCEGRPLLNQSDARFGTADYVIFAGMLLLSGLIGIYFAWVDRKKGTAEYMMGGGNVGPIPIACSLATTFFSSITVLGTPAEFYIYGTMYAYFVVCYLFCTVLVAEIFGPIYRNLGITSTYEYLEIRFSRMVRYLATIVFYIQNIAYIGIVIYAPSLALETVTGIDKWSAVWINGAVCIFYTAIGGLKAVVWTDTLQIVCMIAGFLSIIIDGTIEFGGFGPIKEAYETGGRAISDFSGDPTIRHSFWSVVIGGTLGTWGNLFCATQSFTQRYYLVRKYVFRMLACRSTKDMKIAVYTGFLGISLILALACLCGLVLYANYQCCDPIAAGWVSSKAQLVPYLAVDRFRTRPGAASLFVIGAYGGTLSTVSSGINSMATVLISDYIQPNEKRLMRYGFVPTEFVYTLIGKISSAIFGILCICMAYVAAEAGEGVLQAALSLMGMLGGPNLAVFFLGVFYPWSNKWGAFFGNLCGITVTVWVYVGSKFYPARPEKLGKLDLWTYSCNLTDETAMNSVMSTSMANTTPSSVMLNSTMALSQVMSDDTERPGIADFYELSYMFVGTLGFLVTLIVGLLISAVTGFQNPAKLKPGLFVRWLPGMPLNDGSECDAPKGNTNNGFSDDGVQMR